MSSQHVAIVGGSSGIGLATAAHLLEKGYRVTITGRDKAKLQAAVQNLNGDLTPITMDAADFAGLPAAFEAIGPLDHLVLALGGGNGAGPFATVDLADVRKGFEQKTMAHFACAQACLPYLSKQGSITFVSAVSAQAAMPGTAGLGAINAAIAALAPILAVELKPIRVNCVSPGVVDTPWWDFLSADQKEPTFAGFAARAPVGRVGQPKEIAEAIAFLIDNGFTSGHTLICDGGIRLGQ
ncbi:MULTISPECIES: SDR family oxidoreductase [unclassified Rhizobium]|uniref:SDR family oxidoreductase n=1 Tax=unclassified Rhizobium TaxID=2613769 RepID=UPI00161E8F2C|nr:MULTISPECIES: SDR family oxidoreductase [unclassified Rhizobium]MBB3385661.1 NAD(P)-dependent dehydrogenase (short-subunit alcohol dehydrogenase family) [Rhizobium sp. BK098]MBB3617366.1 NAD(P)-dependent dehydrogenase (short-subunit alcohol dehydrogenase family) [Rhizobium sp. BK609]MBB3682798.1 NAD(P)-dependent dehydrogenase (short-subunit alcohol dehydrogenase family) [Rhizobium sp. BK612]